MKVSYECELNSDELNVLINAAKDAVRFFNNIRLEQHNHGIVDAVNDNSRKIENLANDGRSAVNKLNSRLNSLENWVNAQKRAEKYAKKDYKN